MHTIYTLLTLGCSIPTNPAEVADSTGIESPCGFTPVSQGTGHVSGLVPAAVSKHRPSWQPASQSIQAPPDFKPLLGQSHCPPTQHCREQPISARPGGARTHQQSQLSPQLSQAPPTHSLLPVTCLSHLTTLLHTYTSSHVSSTYIYVTPPCTYSIVSILMELKSSPEVHILPPLSPVLSHILHSLPQFGPFYPTIFGFSLLYILHNH